jgi:hypothetical protein
VEGPTALTAGPRPRSRDDCRARAHQHHIMKRLNEVAQHDWKHSEPVDLTDDGLLHDLSSRDRHEVDQLALHHDGHEVDE